MGFDQEGVQVPPGRLTGGQSSRAQQWHNLVDSSEKTVTFIDLCGHEKYLKTTIFGLVGLCPDFALIVVNANAGVQRMTKEHLGIALALEIPFFIVVTKVDITPPDVHKQHMKMMEMILKSPKVQKLPLRIEGQKDVLASLPGIFTGAACPIFQVSSVTGEGLDLLRFFLSRLQTRHELCGAFRPETDPAELRIDTVYTVPGVGTVVSGTLRAGTVEPNQTLFLGPDKAGKWRPVLVRSIHVKRSPVASAKSGEAVSAAIRSLVRNDKLKRQTFRRGMVMVGQGPEPPKAHWNFEAAVEVLHHATTIKTRYQAVVHCGVIRQAAQVKWMSSEVLRTGDKARVHFQFMYFAEYLRVGETFLFREGRTRGFGKVTAVDVELPEPGPKLSPPARGPAIAAPKLLAP
jgi:GTPase